MKIKCVSKFLCFLVLIISAWMICPLVYSLVVGSGDSGAFVKAILVGFFCSFLLYVFAGRIDMNTMRSREAFVSVTLSWVLASAIGGLPYLFQGAVPTYTDAFFEAMSGFTTTGSTILVDIENTTRGILLWRSITHWLGGMGIIVLTLTIMPLLGIGGTQLFSAESPGFIREKLTPRVQQTAIILWCIYLGLTVVETLFLLGGGMELFDAVSNSMGTIATGGCAPRNESIAYYGSAYVDWMITLFMFLSGANFVLHYQALRGKSPRSFFRDPEFGFYSLLVVTLCLLVACNLYISGTYETIADALRFASFQVVSLVTTTGFVSADYRSWPYFPQTILFFSLFLGGCSGSTSGGLKQIRLLVLCRHVGRHARRKLSPRAVLPLRLGMDSLDFNLVSSCMGFFALYMLLFFAGSFCITLWEPDLITAFSAVATTLGNSGSGFGSIGPYANYSAQSQPAKWLYTFFMLCGRLELYTVLILFSGNFWSEGIVWSEGGRRHEGNRSR